MKKIIIFLGIACLIFIVGCQNQQTACTAEAKICPDGSSVGRTGPACEFAPCPNSSIGIANPASTFCIQNGGTLEIVTGADGQTGICTLSDGQKCEEWAYLRGECPAKPSCVYNNDTYVRPAPCVINFLCIRDKEAFSDDCGCGCRNITSNSSVTPPAPTDKATKCNDPRPDICTMEYMPVCGFFNESIQCIKYPCGATYGNKCTACADQKVAYWEYGECPV